MDHVRACRSSKRLNNIVVTLQWECKSCMDKLCFCAAEKHKHERRKRLVDATVFITS